VAVAAHRTNLLLALVWLGALAGAILSAVALLDRPAAPSAAHEAPARGGQRVATSFGSMSIDYVARLVGDRRPMGVRVGPGEIPIQVGVTLTNVEGRSLRWSPSMLRLPGAARGAVDAGRLPGGAVRARSAHRFVVRAAVPDTAALPSLRFRDPARAAAVVVGLGTQAGMARLDVTSHDFTPVPIAP
jgi:hypothetical protein